MACALSACGKKGPPLAPIAHIPAAVAQPAIERVGSDMYVSLTVPSKDIDGTLPADVARIEVYGITATSTPSATQFLAAGTRVATIPVAKPPDKGEAPPATNEPAQGSTVSIRDSLTAADLVPKTLPSPQSSRSPRASSPATAAPAESSDAAVPQRYYMAIAFSQRGRPGPPGMAASVPLTPLPDPPAHVEATYTSETLTLRWQPTVPPEANASLPAALMTRYNVYRSEGDPLAYPSAAPPPWAARRPTPVNASPLDALMFDQPVDFGRQTCFTVRAVRGAAPADIESDPSSPPSCTTPVDTFPPAAPKSLSAVASEGTISLIWEPNDEPDLGGYLVLRGEPGNDTLQPLTAAPIAEAQFTDRMVKSGVRYVYAVVAVDNRVPVPNVSAASNRVEETAR